MTTADDLTTTDADAKGTSTTAGMTPQEAATTSGEQLVPHDAVADFKSRWEVIQQGFVDDPRSAVQDADSIVDELLKRLSASFEQQRRHLEGQASDGRPNTEELRLALRRYRDFFHRLLAI